MHRQLVQLARSGVIRYALRPVLSRACADQPSEISECLQLGTGEALPLPGYGVELAIKNMEYKAMDDTELKSKSDGAQQGGEISLDDEIAGFRFGRLIDRRPEARDNLAAFRDFLIARETSAEEETLKVWDLKDLGLQAVQRVASSNDPLRLLADISQNFPARATGLSRLRVESELRSEIKRIQKVLPSGTNFLLLNGLMVDVDTLELYSLVERIRHDTRVAENLLMAGISPEAVRALLALRPALADGGTGDIRVDLGSKAPVKYLNNLEKDRMYSGWPKSLQILLMPSFGGQMNPVSRNVFTAVYLMDPLAKTSLQVARSVLSLWQQGLPVRIGTILLPEAALRRARAQAAGQAAELPEWEDVDASERAARAFHMLFKAFGPREAYEFLALIAKDSGHEIADPYDLDYEEEGDEYEEGDLPSADEGSAPSWEKAAAAFEKAWKNAAKRPSSKKAKIAAKLSGAEALQQLAEGSGYAQGMADEVLSGAAHALSKGLTTGPAGAALWFNGIIFTENLERAILVGMQEEMQNVQMQIYQGALHDGSDVAQTILRNSGALPRYNSLILRKQSQGADGEPKARETPLSSREGLDTMDYLMFKESYEEPKQVTHWVVANVDTEGGAALVQQAARFSESRSSGSARTAVLHCGPGPASRLARVVLAAMSLSDQDKEENCAEFFNTLFGPEGEAAREDLGAAQLDDEAAFQAALDLADDSGMSSPKLKEVLGSGLASQEAADRRTAATCAFVRETLKIAEGEGGVVTNGRFVPNLPDEGGALVEEDFHLMSLFAARSQAVDQVAEEILKHSEEADGPGVREKSDQILLASSLLQRLGLRDDMQTDETSLRLAAIVKKLRSSAGALLTWQPQAAGPDGRPSQPALDVTAVVDPLTPGAQKLVSMLLFLRENFAPRMNVWLNPALDLSELPLKSFFRFALPSYGAQGPGETPSDMPGAPEAVFTGLPKKKILTLNVHSPEAWLVEPVRASYDTDNLLLADLPDGEGSVDVDYELEALMITGSCIDVAATSRKDMTPRGVQLHLGDAKRPHVVDTLVMSNLGYFQLKASPGVWSLKLAPGATSALYTVHSSTGISEEGSIQTSSAEAATTVVVSSMNGKHMYLKLKKKPAHAKDDVLTYQVPESELPAAEKASEEAPPPPEEPEAPPEVTPSIWGKLLSMFGSRERRQLREHNTSEVVNIFTVASGHMYERLQKIMILSVLRHTTSPVKFWFIKNYMSPQMKAFLPHFAKAYGFEYELVTYKWPRWLHKQTEKQRIIWAYKILFLDVLFPLNLKKVIFVDADQIVRTDMRELVEMDLHGAPYAYTPFCDNNKDMDGYRFWKSGFWETHLRGKPYHISALYVVDLERFRQTAAGDQLRIIYDGLSKDPNSLANLDQDLPNYAQHKVPIFSLPREWLWCESWCGNKTKAAAKTIDLCNNPMTKEPKLQGARRIVKEWPAYDDEVRAFTARIEAILEGEEGAADVAAEAAAHGDDAGGDAGSAVVHDESEL